jgi:O-antigen ligase
MMRVNSGSRATLGLAVALFGALAALALGALVVRLGPAAAAAGVAAILLAAFVAARPLNALLAGVAFCALVPYWYGHSTVNMSHLEAALALVFIVTTLVLGRQEVEVNRVDYAVVGLLIAAALDWWLRDQNFAAARTSFNTVMPLIFYFAGRLVVGRATRPVLWTLVGATALASLSMFYEFAHGSSVFRDPNSYYWAANGGAAIFRPGGVFGSPPAAVTILAMVTLVAIPLAGESGRTRRRLIQICVAVMVGAGVITFTRAGWIGFGVGLLTYYFLLRWRARIRLPRWLAIVPVLAVAVVLALPVLSQTSWFQLGVERGGTLAVRESYWTLAGKLIVDSPEHLLIGRGLNSLVVGSRPELGGVGASLAETPDLIVEGAHNQYVRTLLEQGLLGIALILLWLGGTIGVAARRMSGLPYTERRLLAGLVGAVVSFLVVSLAGTSMRDTISFSVIALLTGIAVTVATTSRRDTT